MQSKHQIFTLAAVNSSQQTFNSGGAAIAQWFRLCLPSCHPRFDSQAHHLRFNHLQSNLCFICPCIVKRTKINKKSPGLAHFKKPFQFCLDLKLPILPTLQGNRNAAFLVNFYLRQLVCDQCDQKKSPNVHKSCPKMISLEKLKILAPTHKIA